MRRIRSSGTFRMIVGTHPSGSDPTRPGVQGVPLPVRHTVTSGLLLDDAGIGVNGRLVWANSGFAGQTGMFTVNDNDFSTGRTELVIGPYRISDGVDYTVSADAGTTAGAIAAAISRLPGFVGNANGANVIVTASLTTGEVDFRAIHYGQVVNFTALDPSDGFMSGGSPATAGPLLD